MIEGHGSVGMVASLLGFMIGFVAFLGIVAASVYAITDSMSCHQITAAMRMQSRWGFWTGCLVRDEHNRYLPFQIYIQTHYLPFEYMEDRRP